MPENVLYIDNNDNRRVKIGTSLGSIYGAKLAVVDSIDRERFEENTYKLVFVHNGNIEEAYGIFKGHWKRQDATVILFSGGYGVSHMQRLDPHRIRVSSAMIQEKLPEVIKFIGEI